MPCGFVLSEDNSPKWGEYLSQVGNAFEAPSGRMSRRACSPIGRVSVVVQCASAAAYWPDLIAWRQATRLIVVLKPVGIAFPAFAI